MMDSLEFWTQQHAAELSARGMSARFFHGPATDKRAVWLDLDSKHRVGRLTLWVSGEAVLSVADIPSGEMVLEENRQIDTSVGLDDAVNSLVALVAASS
jgi:hypothetical protein